jgi:hypothetical protein
MHEYEVYLYKTISLNCYKWLQLYCTKTSWNFPSGYHYESFKEIFYHYGRYIRSLPHFKVKRLQMPVEIASVSTWMSNDPIYSDSLIPTWAIDLWRFYTYHNYGHYPSSYLLFKARSLGDLVLSPKHRILNKKTGQWITYRIVIVIYIPTRSQHA